MAEYIDIDKAVLVADIRGRELKTTVRHILDINKGIYDTDDVQLVRHGRWIKPTRVPDSMLDECSLCGFDCGAYTFNYCPNCGALMNMEDTYGKTTD